MRTFISVPSRDLIISIGPSTLSMVPRMRTGGGCWAHAAEVSTGMEVNTDRTVNEATNARGIHEEIFGMVFFPQRLWLSSATYGNTPRRRIYSGMTRPRRPCPLRNAAGDCYIGGVKPSRPTLMRLVSNRPSGSFFTKAITLAPGFNSDLLAGT